jgi:UDP-N-acetylmuramate--alanine ligase
MDADHLDIYGTADAVDEAFIDFSGRLKNGGLLVHKYGLPKTNSLKGAVKLGYSVQNENADVYSTNIKDAAWQL